MDQERFDRFTKTLASGHSRRSVLRGMVAGLAAGLGLREASADHRENHGGGGPAEPGKKPGRCGEVSQPCKFGTHCCSGTCLNGYCACPAGQELINGTCQPIDPCAGVVCPDDGNECTTSICVEGLCQTQVLTGSPCDGGTCDASGICIAPLPPGGDGVLDASDPTISSPGCYFDGFYYDTYTFEHTGGEMSLAVRGVGSGGGSILDPILFLFAGASASNPCTGSLAEDDDGGCAYDAYLQTSQPAGTYTTLVLSVDNSTGTYTFERNTFSGGACP